MEADASSPAFAFVKVAGKQFSVGGKAWYPAGTNAFYAAQTDIMSSADVYLMFKVRVRSCAVSARATTPPCEIRGSVDGDPEP